ncbi:hypothetical protein ACHAO1_010331 [Botrytis cinerea]
MGHNYLVPQLCEELCGTRAYVHKFLRNGFNQKVINAWRIDELCEVEEGEVAEVRSRLRLTSNPRTADRVSPISTEEVMYPYCGSIDAGLMRWQFIGGGPQVLDL